MLRMSSRSRARRVLASQRRSSAGRTQVEAVEPRRLMAITLGANMVVNPGAESNAGSASGNDIITPTGWTRSNSATIVKYGAPGGFPTSSSPGPIVRGANFFAGGPAFENSDFFQVIDASNQATTIDQGKLKYQMSAFLGGYASQTDNAWYFLNFQRADGSFISQAVVGPVTPAERGNVTGLINKSKNGTVPAQTRKIQVQIHFEAGTGYVDGYADEVKAIFTSSTATTGSISGTVFNDTNGDGAKQSTETAGVGTKVYVDKNNNNTPDAGDLIANTNASGAYTLSNLPGGNYQLKVQLPAGFRASSANPQAVTVVNGSTASGKNFALTQTALISGRVFGDADGSKTLNGSETGVANVVVYLDFNNNGQYDSFELKTTTDSQGNYKFVVPFGSYVVRITVPSGKTQTTPTAGHSFTVAKGGTASNKLFGIK